MPMHINEDAKKMIKDQTQTITEPAQQTGDMPAQPRGEIPPHNVKEERGTKATNWAETRPLKDGAQRPPKL